MRRNKYGNKKARCLSKHIHDSKFEASYCNRLLAMKQSGEISGYSIQVPYPLTVAGKLICTHIVDFVVIRFEPGHVVMPDKSVQHGDFRVDEAHEVKGFATDVWKIKRRLFEAIYPAVKYIVIKKGAVHVRRRKGQAGGITRGYVRLH